MAEMQLVNAMRAFMTDPGAIRPPVLRAMWAGLHAALPADLAGKLDAAAGLVGLAGVWASLTQDRRMALACGSLLRGVLDAVEREPERWRSLGSQMVRQALFVSGDQPADEGSAAAAAEQSLAPAELAPSDPTGQLPTHYRYAGKLVARAAPTVVPPQ